VHDNETATVANVVDEGGFGFGGPGVAGVVRNDNGVVGEGGAEGGHVAALWRRGDDVDGEEAGVRERSFEEGRGELPVVIVLAGEDEGFQRSRCGGGGGEGEDEECEEREKATEHGWGG